MQFLVKHALVVLGAALWASPAAAQAPTCRAVVGRDTLPCTAAVTVQLVAAPSNPAPTDTAVKPIPDALRTRMQAVVGAYVPVALVRPGSAAAQLDQKFTVYADSLWIWMGPKWEQASGGYDPARGSYLRWLRTGDPTSRHRARSMAVDYRERYLKNGLTTPRPDWSMLDGLVVHYWDTGDTLSRRAVVEAAKRLTSAFPVAKISDSMYGYNEGRIAAKALNAALNAWQLGATDRDWGKLADEYALGACRVQRPDGSYHWRLNSNEPTAAPLWGTSHFMLGILNTELIRYLRVRHDEPAIRDCVIRGARYLRTQWVETEGAFRYWSAGNTSASSQVDVNHLILSSIAWTAQETHDLALQAWADLAFARTVPRAWYYAGKVGKQFWQQFYNSAETVAALPGVTP